MHVETSVGHKNNFYLVQGDVCEFSKAYFGKTKQIFVDVTSLPQLPQRITLWMCCS